MESLPLDTVENIVSRVPAESIFECKLVCERWGNLIRASNFANMHLSRQLNHLYGGDDGNDNIAEPCLFFACETDNPEDYTTLLFLGGQLSDGIGIDGKYVYNQNLKRIYHPLMHTKPFFDHLVGSCNGLVCAFRHHDTILDPIYICNPLTREYCYLPELVIKKEDVDPRLLAQGEVNMSYNTGCGFGYVRSTNDYKVVRIHYLTYEEGEVEVYTLGSGCGWRAIGTVPYRLDTSGTYANDAIYWIANNKVVVFDLAKEEFRLIAVPPCLQNRRNRDRCGLVVLGRQLCLYMDKSGVEIWSLDSKETWCMEFEIDYEAIVGSRKIMFQPILLTKNGQVIFLYARSVLYCYDTKTTILKMISNEASTDHLGKVEVIAHVNTFASLKAMGENSRSYMVRTPCDDVIDLSEEIDITRFRLGSSAI